MPVPSMIAPHDGGYVVCLRIVADWEYWAYAVMRDALGRVAGGEPDPIAIARAALAEVDTAELGAIR